MREIESVKESFAIAGYYARVRRSQTQYQSIWAEGYLLIYIFICDMMSFIITIDKNTFNYYYYYKKIQYISNIYVAC